MADARSNGNKVDLSGVAFSDLMNELLRRKDNCVIGFADKSGSQGIWSGNPLTCLGLCQVVQLSITDSRGLSQKSMLIIKKEGVDDTSHGEEHNGGQEAG